MQVTSEQIIAGLHELFPESEEMSLTKETVLGDLPEWDSMAAVNLQTWLFQTSKIETPLELLADETSVADLLSFMATPVSSEAV